METLLGALRLEAAISLPPILHILSCLARDLQQDFLLYLPRVLNTLSNLVESGVLSIHIRSQPSGYIKHLQHHGATVT